MNETSKKKTIPAESLSYAVIKQSDWFCKEPKETRKRDIRMSLSGIILKKSTIRKGEVKLNNKSRQIGYRDIMNV